MGSMQGVLKEEYKRLKFLEKSYLREISKLPKGSLQDKRIKGAVYPYWVVSQQSKVRYRYVGNLPAGKLKLLKETGFFGDILSVRGEFGYWVFEGDTIPPNRPSWNYRKEDGGGIILDMLCHWRYLLDHVFGQVRAVSCLGATHVDRRWDEQGHPYEVTADDSAYATFELDGGIIAHFNASWCVRVRRDDLLTIQVDGTKGSAVAGLRECYVQPYGATPRPVWNPDVPQPLDFFDGWTRVPDNQDYDNAFKIEWELFLRHVVADEPFPYTLLEAAKGVQLAELGLESWKRRAWVEVPALDTYGRMDV